MIFLKIFRATKIKIIVALKDFFSLLEGNNLGVRMKELASCSTAINKIHLAYVVFVIRTTHEYRNLNLFFPFTYLALTSFANFRSILFVTYSSVRGVYTINLSIYS